MENTVKVKNYEAKVPSEIIEVTPFEVNFNGELLLLIDKTETGFKVINGVNGYGQNVRTEYENEPVIIL